MQWWFLPYLWTFVASSPKSPKRFHCACFLPRSVELSYCPSWYWCVHPTDPLIQHHSSDWVNGFSICSLPSRGDIRTSRVPRATIRPRGRVVSLPASSGRLMSVFNNRKHTAQAGATDGLPKRLDLTSQRLPDIIQHQIHQLIVSLQCPNDYTHTHLSAISPSSPISLRLFKNPGRELHLLARR